MERRAFFRSLEPGRAVGVQPPTGVPHAKPVKSDAGLDPYQPDVHGPWDRRRVIHLLSRTGVGRPSRSQVDRALGMTPEQVVDERLTMGSLPEPPDWINASLEFAPPDDPEELARILEQDRLRRLEFLEWLCLLWQDNGSMRERLTLGWLNHFVVEAPKVYFPQFLLQYNQLIRFHAARNLRQMVLAVGRSAAMVIYLDGHLNTRFGLNENYGRELQELFTIGRGNYTQADVVAAARAYTGWQIDPETPGTVFNQSRFDSGDKTFYGQTGPWNDVDIVNMIFEQFETARFLAERLYREYVYQVPDPEIVDQLATILWENDFELRPVLRRLFLSAHFHDGVFFGAEETSPVDYLFGTMRYLGIEDDSVPANLAAFLMAALGQPVMDPPNVEGWPGSRAWISTTSLPYRQALIGYLTEWTGNNPVFDLETFLAQFGDLSDPGAFLDALILDLSPFPMSKRARMWLFDILTGGSPQSWDPADEQTLARIRYALVALMQQANYQLA